MALSRSELPNILTLAETDPSWYPLLRHNAAVLKAIIGGTTIVLESPLAFDPRQDYWYRLERRALVAYLARRFSRPTAAFHVVRELALAASLHLDALRARGGISFVGVDYDAHGGISHNLAPIIQHLESMPPVPAWAGLVAGNSQRKLLGTASEDLRVFLVEELAKRGFTEPGFVERIPWWCYLGSKDLDEVASRRRFFYAYVHAITPVNAYRHGGSQHFATIIQNTPTSRFLDALRGWREGQDTTACPLLGAAIGEPEHSDKSDNNIIRELWCYLNLHRAAPYNSRTTSLIGHLGRDDSPLTAMLALGRETRAWLEANPAERERAARLLARLVEDAKRSTDRPWATFEAADGDGVDAPADRGLSSEIQQRAMAELLAQPELDRAAMGLHLALDHWSFRHSAGYDAAPELASRAEDSPRASTPPDTSPNPAAVAGPLVLHEHERVWLYAPGAGASEWESCRDEGVAIIGWDELGSLDEFTDKQSILAALTTAESESHPTNDALSLWSFAREMQVGDPIVARRGRTQVIGIGQITTDYRYDPARPYFHHVRGVRWLWTGDEKLNINLPLKTITNTARRTALIDALQRILTRDVPDAAPTAEPTPPPVPTYTLGELTEESFLDQSQIDTMVALLRRKKNIILQGPPGVGKTWIARRLAYLLMGARDRSRVEMVQFHPAYTYEDFIRGYRAKGKEGFVVEDGIFLKFADLARGDPDSDYVLIIDEINRGHLGKIFGELMMLIEADKRGPEWDVALAHSRNDGDERFYVPDNLHLIGTMNTADRSLALVDYALRRRFAFVDIGPRFTSPRFAQAWGHAPALLAEMRAAIASVNKLVADDPQLGVGFLIGHSYFCTPDAVDTERWLRDVYVYEILPLLREYWFDNPSVLADARGRLGLRDLP